MILDGSNINAILSFFGYSRKDILLVHYKLYTKQDKQIRRIDLITGKHIGFGYTRINRDDGRIEDNLSYLDCANNQRGPSFVRLFRDGSINSISYRQNNTKHRSGGPAEIVYNFDGSKMAEYYFCGGHLHNPVGPAIWSNANKYKRWVSYFYINGTEIDLNEFCERMEARFSCLRG